MASLPESPTAAPPRVLVFVEKALALSETFIAAHVRALTRYEPTLVAIEGSYEHHRDVPRELLYGEQAGRIERLLFRLGISRRMDALIAQLKPDLVHAHYLMSGAFVAPFAVRHGLPLVVTVHGHDAARNFHRLSLYNILYRRWRGFLQAHADRVLPVSRYLEGKVKEQGFAPERITVHYLGIPLDDTKPANVARSPARIVFAGRLVEKKGIDKVLEAFSLVRRALPRAELHIAGDGPMMGLAREAAAREPGITLYGAQPHERILALMREARLFTMPSRETGDDSEGFGLVLIEAQSLGIPVVTSAETGTSETLFDGVTGYAVDGRDAASLAQAFRRLLEAPELAASMGAAAHRFVHERFDIVERTRILEDLYDEVRLRREGQEGEP